MTFQFLDPDRTPSWENGHVVPSPKLGIELAKTSTKEKWKVSLVHIFLGWKAVAKRLRAVKEPEPPLKYVVMCQQPRSFLPLFVSLCMCPTRILKRWRTAKTGF